MSLLNLDKAALKLILKTSQGFGSQFESSQAMVTISNGARFVSPSRAGHAVSSHLRGVQSTPAKTKFCSLGDMAAALELLLKTPQGQQALGRLAPQGREQVKAEINRTFPVEAVVTGIGAVTFTTRDLAAAHIHRLPCVAVLEGRSRAGQLHLHIQTFYPAVTKSQLETLFDVKTS